MLHRSYSSRYHWQLPPLFCGIAVQISGPYNCVCWWVIYSRICGHFIYDGQVFSCHLHSFNSVFTAELYALYRVLLVIWYQPCCHLMCTDFPSALQCLDGYSLNHPIIAGYLDTVACLTTRQPCMQFSFLTELPAVIFALACIMLFYPHGRTNGIMLKGTDCTWWNHMCRSDSSSSRVMRKEEVGLVCLRIGCLCLTHGHLLCGEPAPVCRNCDVHLTVADILVDCLHMPKFIISIISQCVVWQSAMISVASLKFWRL